MKKCKNEIHAFVVRDWVGEKRNKEDINKEKGNLKIKAENEIQNEFKIKLKMKFKWNVRN